MKALIPSRLVEFIFAIILGYVGISWHFMNAGEMAGLVPGYIPGDAKIWVYIIGAGFVLAALSFFSGMQKTLAGYLLALMMLIFAFTIHLQPATEGNMASFIQDIVFALCAILIANRGAKR